MKTTASTFKTSEVCELTALTARQLQILDEQGIVIPARQGHRRVYSQVQLLEVRLLSAIRRQGITLRQAEKVLIGIRRNGLSICDQNTSKLVCL